MDSTVISRFFDPPHDGKGQIHLPGKELRYFNTVIVTADIDEGFGHSALGLRLAQAPLTFSHRSGVTPYTFL